MKLARAMATVAGMTAISRIAGFVRDILTAALLGAGPIADAFFVALKLPNLFRRITAEGAFSVSFVPLFTETLEKEGAEAARRFAGEAFAVMCAGLSVFVLVCLMAMPWVIALIAPGFLSDPESADPRYGLAVEMSRITFPYLLLMSLAALLGGVLNAMGRFAPFAVAPVLFNLSLIVALLVGGLAQSAGYAMAWGVSVAGVLQLGWLWFCARRAGFRLPLVRPRFTPRVRRVFVLMGPGLIGAGVMQINLFADMIIASLVGTGAISALYYADRLVQLPLGMVGIAVGTALLPMLSRAQASGDPESAQDLFNRALEYCLLLALPAATGLLVMAAPLVTALFGHGAFTREAAAMTTTAIQAYVFGIPAYIAVKVFATAFWARQDTLRPVIVSAIATGVNIALSLWLVLGLGIGIVGIAIGTAVAGWIQIALFGWILFRRGDVRLDSRFCRNAWRIALACVLMGGLLWILQTPLVDIYGGAGKAAHIVITLGLVAGGGVLYGGAILGMRVIRVSDLKVFLRRRSRS